MDASKATRIVAGTVSEEHIVRHTAAERGFHWTMASLIFILLVSAFAPILGWQFDWVPVHWVSGVLFTLLILAYVVGLARSFRIRSMIVEGEDLRNVSRTIALTLGRGDREPKPAKYLVLQKLFYWGMVVWVPVLIVTGLLMLAKLDTPFWHRNPYWLSEFAWGIIYTIHGFFALTMLGLVILHVYFALRPEKLYLLRSMIVGWITRSEYLANYDPKRWPAEPADEK